ncbi:hypothetical protein BG011_002928 [Mortierella polycephala]|uniref:Nodulin-like domain-containing protein n=1 Tax=Mortierella polycephala TaxID=41804 RepID=A0A9P6QHB6_9FUNG|nr:hypothetical protein BG011_002928 [Mortierella polycephala]
MTHPISSYAWRPWLLAGSFICACLNMLASGSLYVFALYSPALKNHLGYSQTQTSTIAIIGDIGLYGFGPLSGLMADRLGPRPTSFFAGCLLFLGYSLLSTGFAKGMESVQQGEEPTHFLLMSGFLFLAGMGSSTSYMAAFTSLAKNFQRARGIALGVPVSFFGLSAAVLTLIAQGFFTIKVGNFGKPSSENRELDTTHFLLFLGLAGGLINGLAVFGMNIVPPAKIVDSIEHANNNNNNDTTSNTESEQVQQDVGNDHTIAPSEQTPLLQDDASTESIATLKQQQRNQHLRRPVRSLSGRAFFMDRDAQYFFVVMVCLAGTGLMIINSISAMVDVVAASETSDIPIPTIQGGMPGQEVTSSFLRRLLLEDKNPLASIHAMHVGLISIASYTGRMVAAIGTDVAIARKGAHRIDALPLATGLMALSQVVGMFASIRWLYLCSIITGFSYGGFFGVAGTIVAELWGEETCGQNWGWLSWGSALGGMLFNLLFGVVMDAARPVVDGRPQECKGHGCFRWALVISCTACTLSCGLSILMGVRQRRAAAAISDPESFLVEKGEYTHEDLG